MEKACAKEEDYSWEALGDRPHFLPLKPLTGDEDPRKEGRGVGTAGEHSRSKARNSRGKSKLLACKS